MDFLKHLYRFNFLFFFFSTIIVAQPIPQPIVKYLQDQGYQVDASMEPTAQGDVGYIYKITDNKGEKWALKLSKAGADKQRQYATEVAFWEKVNKLSLKDFGVNTTIIRAGGSKILLKKWLEGRSLYSIFKKLEANRLIKQKVQEFFLGISTDSDQFITDLHGMNIMLTDGGDSSASKAVFLDTNGFLPAYFTPFLYYYMESSAHWTPEMNRLDKYKSLVFS